VQLRHLRRAAPNLVDETILAELIVSPVDLERSNPHMWHGTFHGGDARWQQRRAGPAPGWRSTGCRSQGCTRRRHNTPGGSVTGGPGATPPSSCSATSATTRPKSWGAGSLAIHSQSSSDACSHNFRRRAAVAIRDTVR